MPTPTVGPPPTPTPPAPIYLSDPSIVNTYTTGNQRRASVAIGADDNYLIVWNSDAAQAGFYDIKGQLFTRDGVKIGSEFQVDQAGANRLEYTPNVASDGGGNYVVVWADFNQTVTDSEIWVRRFDGAANPLGDAVQVNTYTTARQRLPRVAADSIGQFVVVWESEGQDGSGLGVFGQQFDETGAPVGSEFAGQQHHHDRRSGPAGGGHGRPGLHRGIRRRERRHRGAGVRHLSPPRDRASFPSSGRITGSRTSPASTATDQAPFSSPRTPPRGAIDGIRMSRTVSPKSPFTTVPSGFNPRLARHARHHAASGAANRDPPEAEAAWLAWEKDFLVYCQRYGFDPGIRVYEEFYFPWILANDSRHRRWPERAVAVATQTRQRPGYGRRWSARCRASIPSPFRSSTTTRMASSSPMSRPISPRSRSTGRRTPRLTLNGLIGSSASGLAPEALTIDDPTADYGTIPPGSTADCQATGDCYGITVSGARPGVHWDESVVETLSIGVHKTWLLHIGQSFADVPTTNLFYAFIENLLHNGVTAGGACGGYCPTDGVKRQQMAVFLLKARFGPSFTPPPATGTIFTDVTLANPFAAWIEALYLLGITGGCSGGPPPAPTQFCPDAIVNRQQMAVFLLKTLEGSAYVPPDATGIFQDVPLTNPFVKWIEELYARQVTGGCVVSPLQYCPANPTNRQQMAAFLVKTFGLLLYGP